MTLLDAAAMAVLLLILTGVVLALRAQPFGEPEDLPPLPPKPVTPEPELAVARRGRVPGRHRPVLVSVLIGGTY